MKAFAGLLAVLLMLSCTSLAQTAPDKPADPSSTPVAATPSTGDAASAPAVPAGTFGPGAKIFLERTNGFESLLSDAIAEKKVPVVLVKHLEDADFIMAGDAHLKTPNFFTGMVLTKHGGATVSIKDAHTDKLVFACNFHRVDEGERPGDIYIGWAGQCAQHLEKLMKQDLKRAGSSAH